MRELEHSSPVDLHRENILVEELESRKKSEAYLNEKIKTIELNYTKLSSLLKELESRYIEQSK